MLTMWLYISIPHAKRKIILLVSRVVVKSEGNVPRTWNSQLSPSAKVLSAQKGLQAGNSSHTLYSPTPCKMKQFGAMISLEWAGATGRSALFIVGMQRFSITGKKSLILPGAGSSAHSTGWQLHGENVHEKLSTLRHRLSKMRLQALHLWVTNAFSGGLQRGDCMQTLLHTDDYSI